VLLFSKICPPFFSSFEQEAFQLVSSEEDLRPLPSSSAEGGERLIFFCRRDEMVTTLFLSNRCAARFFFLFTDTDRVFSS